MRGWFRPRPAVHVTQLTREQIAVAFRAHQADALTAAGYGPVKAAGALIRDLTDPDDCSFDHHGGCQAHGYLSLEIGEMCPQLGAKAWLHNHAAALEADQ